MQLRFQSTPVNVNAQVYRNISSCINLQQIGHAPGLALLSKVSLGLFRTLVRVFDGFSQISLGFTLLTLGLGHQLVRTGGESSRIYTRCICVSYFGDNDLFNSSLQGCNPTQLKMICKIFCYPILGNHLQINNQQLLVHRAPVGFPSFTNTYQKSFSLQTLEIHVLSKTIVTQCLQG